jgi:crotonobetainyl-CoA:carnitine CoA-transferase CaiB-like acyl-CoA transferase
MPDAPAALHDVRVIDLSGEIGAYCTKLLGDLGADVIKVEPPTGDSSRGVGPFYHDQPGPEHSLYFFNLNTSKRGITLDLRADAGLDVARKLIATADIVVESFRPGELEALGLGYDAPTALRQDIIVTSITGFGQNGPHAGFLAPDIVGVAMGGIMWLAGDPEDPPNVPYGFQGYISASIQAAAGTMMALYHRDITGEGQHVDVSMQEALLISQETAMQTWDLNKGIRNRTGARTALPFPVPGIGPYQTTDGWIWSYLGTPGGAPWTDVLKWMEEEGASEDLSQTPYSEIIAKLDIRYLTGLAIDKDGRERDGPHLEYIDQVLRRFYAARTKAYLYEHGQGRRILIGIVSTPEDLANNAQLNARDWFQQVEHPDLGETLRYPGPPYRLSKTPWRITRRAPHLGEHNAEVLSELGYSPSQIEAFAGAQKAS